MLPRRRIASWLMLLLAVAAAPVPGRAEPDVGDPGEAAIEQPAAPGTVQPVAPGAGSSAPGSGALAPPSSTGRTAPVATSGLQKRAKTSTSVHTCRSPRQTLSTLVSNLRPESYDPARAAACLDRAGLEHPATDAPALALKLKKVLDAEGLEIDLEEVPDDPEHLDAEGAARYEPFPRELPGIALTRVRGRWLVSADSLERVQEHYREIFPLSLEELQEVLPAWLRIGLLGVELWQLLGLLLLVLLAMGLQRLVVLAVGTYLRRLVGRLSKSWVESALHRSGAPISGLAFALLLDLGLPILHFSARANRIADLAVSLLAAFSAVWLGYRLVDVLAEVMGDRAARTESKLDDQLVPLLRMVFKVIIVAIGSLFILQNLDIDIGSLLAGLGLGGLAIALAAKDTLANFFGSLMIFIDKPFQIGDWIKIGNDIEGNIEEVGFRSTRVRTFYNSLITMPNARITDSAIDNMGARRYRRYRTTLGLTYDTSSEKVQAFCEGVRAILQGLPGMRKDLYWVEFTDYSASSLDIQLNCFMESPSTVDELRTRTYLNLEILRLAERLGVSFAFPTRTVHLVPPQPPDAGGATPLPPEPARLAEVVRDFGPGGALARPRGVDLQVCFDPPGAEACPPAPTPQPKVPEPQPEVPEPQPEAPGPQAAGPDGPEPQGGAGGESIRGPAR